uniref:phosphatidylinositol phosphate synthase n=1 Tax=Candidatus Planktophila sp. TaxID=2175601 RepID=UPI004049060A
MISAYVKPQITRLINPVVKAAVRVGITANAVTIFGGLGTVMAALYFYPRGDLFLGTIIISLFALSDLFDGAIARRTGGEGTSWGGFLDSTIDRVTDSAILIGALLYFIDEDETVALLVLISLVVSGLIPYIRAKAESMKIECSGGIAERTERLIIALTALGLYGLGIEIAAILGFTLLALLGTVTVVQRIVIVYIALRRG